MAQSYALGGSPLGLINVKSRPERTGMSTFNGGNARNINVFSYNRGVPQPTNVKYQSKEGLKEGYAPASLLSGGSFPNIWPNADIGKIGTEEHDQGSQGIKSKTDVQYKPQDGKGVSSNVHNDSSYDTSLLNVIERLSKTKSGALRPQDFAYCKYLGVYPNNRLMVARRFSAPTKDNIFGKGGGGVKSVLVSWKPETEDFLEISFGEEWMDADADFTNVLNKLGKDFGIDNAGVGLSKALNIIPLPGFTEGLQQEILYKLGILNAPSDTLPAGNPNLIKIAKRRKTIGYGEAGAGLRANISIKMDCEYEQKFISGIDPSAAWQDILNNILIFGTSNSSNYGLSGRFEANLQQWMNNPGVLVKQVIEAVQKTVTKVVTEIKTKAQEALKKLEEANKPVEDDGLTDEEREEKKKEADLKAAKELIQKAESKLTYFFEQIKKSAFKTISKYRIEIMGIANALSGAPSAPWHITLGNPLRPFFSSGDMWISQDVTLKFGPVLAFNDLPSSIKVSFTLQNARPLGMQEILAKFHMGSLRTVNVKKDFTDTDFNFSKEDEAKNIDQWTPQYFDGIFDQFGKELNPQAITTTGSSVSGSPAAVGQSGSGIIGIGVLLGLTGSEIAQQLFPPFGPFLPTEEGSTFSTALPFVSGVLGSVSLSSLLTQNNPFIFDEETGQIRSTSITKDNGEDVVQLPNSLPIPNPSEQTIPINGVNPQTEFGPQPQN